MTPSHVRSPVRVYCEHGALTARTRQLQRAGVLTLIHFPYDAESRYRQSEMAVPSAAQIRDLNLSISDLPGVIADYVASDVIDRIRDVVGQAHRRDVLHIDSAVKSGCAAFLTCDRDILDVRTRLEEEIGLKFFDPVAEADAFEACIAAIRDAG